MASKKGKTTTFFLSFLFCVVLEVLSGIRGPESGMGKNQDPESVINIQDSQHWVLLSGRGPRCGFVGCGVMWLSGVSVARRDTE